MRTSNRMLAAITLAILLFPFTGSAQTRTLRIDSTGTRMVIRGGMFRIPEIGAFVIKGEKELQIDRVMPPNERPQGYSDVDIREGDLVLMINGTRVKSPSELETQYNAVPIGGEVKLGVQRESQMLIASFKRADPKSLPQVRTMMIRTDGKDDMRPLPEIGVILQEKKSGVRVQSILPRMAEALPGADVREGDIVKAINGTAVRTMKDFARVYDAIPVGGKVAWKGERGGTPVSFSFSKPEARGTVIIKRRSGQ